MYKITRKIHISISSIISVNSTADFEVHEKNECWCSIRASIRKSMSMSIDVRVCLSLETKVEIYNGSQYLVFTCVFVVVTALHEHECRKQ